MYSVQDVQTPFSPKIKNTLRCHYPDGITGPDDILYELQRHGLPVGESVRKENAVGVRERSSNGPI